MRKGNNILELPEAISSEIAVIGAMLAFPAQAKLWAPRIRFEWLSQEIATRVLKAILDIIQTGREPTFFAVENALRATFPMDSGIGSQTWQQVLAHMAAEVTTTDLSGEILNLKSVWALRQIVDLANGLAAISDIDRVTQLNDTWERIDDVRTAIIDTESTRARIGPIAGEVVSNAEYLHETGEQPKGVTTGLPRLDDAILGYRPGELIIVAGRPGMGKTSWGTSSALAASAVNRPGRRAGVAFFSLELSRDAIGARCLSDVAYDPLIRITHSEIRGLRLSDAQLVRLREAKEQLDNHALIVECVGSATVHEIEVRARSIARSFERHGISLGVIFVDYLKFVKATDRYKGNRVYEIGEITRALREMAKRLCVCVVLLCQINRAVEQRDNKRPQLSDLRDSGDLENDADVVILLYREAYYLGRDARGEGPQAVSAAARLEQVEDQIELIVAKNRNGEGEQTIGAFCDIGASVIRPIGSRGQ